MRIIGFSIFFHLVQYIISYLFSTSKTIIMLYHPDHPSNAQSIPPFSRFVSFSLRQALSYISPSTRILLAQQLANTASTRHSKKGIAGSRSFVVVDAVSSTWSSVLAACGILILYFKRHRETLRCIVFGVRDLSVGRRFWFK